MEGRIAPVAKPWSPEDETGIRAWGHPQATYDPLLLTRCLLRHPRMAARTRQLGESIYVDGRLPARLRTLAILRACSLVECAYEWGGQAAFWGPLTGLSEEDCDATVLASSSDPRWSAEESALLVCVDELEATGSLSDAAWSALTLDDEQRMELMIVVGWYRTICTLCNGMALPVEGWMRPWPR